MIRLLLLVFVVALGVLAWRLVRQALTPPAAGAGDAPRFEPTGRCARCGTHVPRVQLDEAGVCGRCRGQA